MKIGEKKNVLEPDLMTIMDPATPTAKITGSCSKTARPPP